MAIFETKPNSITAGNLNLGLDFSCLITAVLDVFMKTWKTSIKSKIAEIFNILMGQSAKKQQKLFEFFSIVLGIYNFACTS